MIGERKEQGGERNEGEERGERKEHEERGVYLQFTLLKMNLFCNST